MADNRVEIVISAKNLASGALTDISSSLERMRDSAMRFGTILTASVSLPLAGVGVAAVKMAGDLEQSKIAFGTLLGSAQKADLFIKGLFDFAKTTPFEFVGLQEASKKMLAFGFQAEQIIPMMTAIGNAAAGLGGSEELIGRITLAIGQMQAKGKVSAQEMMQLAEAGIPAWEILAKHIGVTIPEAMKLAEKGGIDSTAAITGLIEGMNARFGGLMEKQSTTVLGLFSTLKDGISQDLIIVGNEIIKTFDLQNKLQSAINAIESITKWFVSLDDSTKKVIIGFGAFVGILGPALIAIGGLITVVGALSTAFSAGLATIGAVAIFMTGPFGLAVAAVVAAVTAAIVVWRNWDTIMGFLREKVAALMDAIQHHLVDRFARAVEAVKEQINRVKGFFSGLYDAVVGRSYVPDMITEIGVQMGPRLQLLMVEGARKNVVETNRVFSDLRVPQLAPSAGSPPGAGRFGLEEPARLSLSGAVSTVPAAPDLSFGSIGGPIDEAMERQLEQLERIRTGWEGVAQGVQSYIVAQQERGEIDTETMQSLIRQNAVMEISQGLQRAATTALQQWILGQSKLGPALRAAAAQELATIAAKAGVYAVMATALGFYRLAEAYGASTPGSIAAFKSAAEFAAVAGIAGAAASGLARGGNAAAGPSGSPLNPVSTRDVGGSAEQTGRPMQITVHVNALDPASVNWDGISQNIAESLGRHLERGGSAGPVQISFQRS